ncbi:amidohydrolase family protein [Gottfriedia acidiceleris]|uniref:amidohydrolase family protein n=1 Tax=Gottfriedia acidiceleris TaxID=371036 RepID=UPI002FFEEF29
MKTLKDSGAILAFGTDYPIVPLNPMLGIYRALTRIGYDGSLGKLADLVVLDKNLFEIPVEELQNVRVVLTMVDGAIVFQDITEDKKVTL